VISPSTVRALHVAGNLHWIQMAPAGARSTGRGDGTEGWERIAITARLVDVHTGRLIWAESYDYPAADWGQIQAEAAEGGAQVGRHLAIPTGGSPSPVGEKKTREELAQGFRREFEAPFAPRWADSGAERSLISCNLRI